MIRGRCSAAWAVVEYHITGLKLPGYTEHLFIAIHESLGPVFTAYYTEMLPEYGIGVEQEVKTVTGIKGNLLMRAVFTAKETGAYGSLYRLDLSCG